MFILTLSDFSLSSLELVNLNDLGLSSKGCVITGVKRIYQTIHNVSSVLSRAYTTFHERTTTVWKAETLSLTRERVSCLKPVVDVV